MLAGIKEKIRAVKDFPKEGIIFRDITTALKDADVMAAMIDYLYEQYKDKKIDYIVGLESRGFIVGMPLAYKLHVGFVPIRKPGKLPADKYSQTYDLEYGSDTIEMHKDAIEEGANVLLVDDLLATGGTACAACNLIRKAKGNIVGAAFWIELNGLNGRQKLKEFENCEVISMLQY
ncbi:adenine phosphoribosyltransferase [bacterium]|nr:adenine phosphoribosyltransferase [bacterium]